ncbi:MAG: TlyA family RNA methyltransferase [Polyangiaceae bacterium]
MPKVRLDSLLVERKLAESRARAQAVILAGNVYVAGHRVDKAGSLVPADASVEVRVPDHPYVSRGGAKLAGALDTFALGVQGLSCLDVGASTGGFTDCLLQRGAASVVAVDVGYGQLAHKLRVDPRVALHERTNARNLEPAQIGGPVDLSVVDASFISLRTLVGALARCTRPGGALVALVKPQFEVGRKVASQGKGVVRDPEERAKAVGGAREAVVEGGFEVMAECDSALPGPKGNVEAFLYARRIERPG